MEISFVRNLLRPSSIEASILFNPEYALWVGQSVVLVCDSQFMMGKTILENLRDPTKDFMQVSGPSRFSIMWFFFVVFLTSVFI